MAKAKVVFDIPVKPKSLAKQNEEVETPEITEVTEETPEINTIPAEEESLNINNESQDVSENIIEEDSAPVLTTTEESPLIAAEEVSQVTEEGGIPVVEAPKAEYEEQTEIPFVEAPALENSETPQVEAAPVIEEAPVIDVQVNEAEMSQKEEAAIDQPVLSDQVVESQVEENTIPTVESTVAEEIPVVEAPAAEFEEQTEIPLVEPTALENGEVSTEPALAQDAIVESDTPNVDAQTTEESVAPFANPNEPNIVEEPVVAEPAVEPQVEATPAEENPEAEEIPIVEAPKAEYEEQTEIPLTEPTPIENNEVPTNNEEAEVLDNNIEDALKTTDAPTNKANPDLVSLMSDEVKMPTNNEQEEIVPVKEETGQTINIENGIIPDTIDQDYGVIKDSTSEQVTNNTVIETQGRVHTSTAEPVTETAPAAEDVAAEQVTTPEQTNEVAPSDMNAISLTGDAAADTLPEVTSSNNTAVTDVNTIKEKKKKSPVKIIILAVVGLIIIGIIALVLGIYKMFSVDFIKESTNKLREASNEYNTLLNSIDAYQIISENDEWQFVGTVNSTAEKTYESSIEGGMSKSLKKFTFKDTINENGNVVANLNYIAQNRSTYINLNSDSYYYRFVHDEPIDFDATIASYYIKPYADKLADIIDSKLNKDLFTSNILRVKINGKVKLVNSYSYTMPKQKALDLVNELLDAIDNDIIKEYLIGLGIKNIYGDVEIKANVSFSGLEQIVITNNGHQIKLSVPKKNKYVIVHDAIKTTIEKNANKLSILIEDTDKNTSTKYNIDWESSKKDNSGYLKLNINENDKKKINMDVEVKSVPKAALDSQTNVAIVDTPQIEEMYNNEYQALEDIIKQFMIIKK